MSERDLWHTTREALKWYGHLDRIENMVGRGRPDVNYCIRGHHGDIELKHRPSWPRGAETVVTFDHFTPQQRNWIRARLNAGGRVFVLVQVERWYGLFLGDWARLHLGVDATRADMDAHAVAKSDAGFPLADVLPQLTDGAVTSSHRLSSSRQTMTRRPV